MSVPPTTPTWSLTGSRPEPAARPGQTNLVGLPPTPLGHPAVVLGQNNVLGHSVVQNKEKTSPEKKNDKQLYIISVPAGNTLFLFHYLFLVYTFTENRQGIMKRDGYTICYLSCV